MGPSFSFYEGLLALSLLMFFVCLLFVVVIVIRRGTARVCRVSLVFVVVMMLSSHNSSLSWIFVGLRVLPPLLVEGSRWCLDWRDKRSELVFELGE